MPELRGSFAAATCRLRSVTRVLRVHRLSELPIFPGMPVIARFFGTTNPMLPTSKFVLFYQAASQQHAAGPALPSKPPSSQSPRKPILFIPRHPPNTKKEDAHYKRPLFPAICPFLKSCGAFAGKTVHHTIACHLLIKQST